MPTFSHDCPHCGTRHVGFNILAEHRPPRSKLEIYAFVSCGACGGACVSLFMVKEKGYSLKNDFESAPHKSVEFYPRPQVPDVPDHLPENVRKFFLQGVDNVKTGPDAAGAMFRKALDAGLKHIDPDLKGSLYERIKSLAEKGTITEDLATWADRIRLDGNVAVHEDELFTRERAESLHHFTQLVMMYLFTLPGMLNEWSGEDAE